MTISTDRTAIRSSSDVEPVFGSSVIGDGDPETDTDGPPGTGVPLSGGAESDTDPDGDGEDVTEVVVEGDSDGVNVTEGVVDGDGTPPVAEPDAVIVGCTALTVGDGGGAVGVGGGVAPEPSKMQLLFQINSVLGFQFWPCVTVGMGGIRSLTSGRCPWASPVVNTTTRSHVSPVR